ncbi:hypothetical protein BJX61DRAFT_530538 [Aspergillus egyptiacus]|nr:hypothetical protein BJX61DRAFT_530538 [Aspergillus egyptiacus]
MLILLRTLLTPIEAVLATVTVYIMGGVWLARIYVPPEQKNIRFFSAQVSDIFVWPDWLDTYPYLPNSVGVFVPIIDGSMVTFLPDSRLNVPGYSSSKKPCILFFSLFLRPLAVSTGWGWSGVTRERSTAGIPPARVTEAC